MSLLRKFRPIDDKKKTTAVTGVTGVTAVLPKIPKSIHLGALGVTVSGGGVVIAVLVVAFIFLGVWIAGLVRMRRSCPGVPPSIYWILTLVLGLVPTGATQLAALVMAGYGLARPAIGCRR